MQNTRVGQLLPFQPSNEPCNGRGVCFVAGDTRENENTSLENTITNPEIRRDLWKAYGSPDNHIDLFPVGISETNDGDKLIGRKFRCILGNPFEELREGELFYYENINVTTLPQER